MGGRGVAFPGLLDLEEEKGDQGGEGQEDPGEEEF